MIALARTCEEDLIFHLDSAETHLQTNDFGSAATLFMFGVFSS